MQSTELRPILSLIQKPSLSIWGQVHDISCENEFYLHKNKKSFSYQRLSTYSRFDQRPGGTQKWLIANKHFFKIWGNEVSHAYNKSNVFWLFQIWNSWFWLFQTFFGCSKHWNYWFKDYLMQTLKFLISAFPNTRTLDFGFPDIGILDFGLPTFGIHCVGFSKHQNSVFWLFQTLEFSILAFPQHGFLD